MNSREIVRSWKDEDYRLSLINKEQALAPENPAGLLELKDEDLVAVEGGTDPITLSVIIIVTTYMSYQLCSWPACPTAFC
jgi:mersacidin/lichenicidin family type 2 lantibiotic